MTMRTRKQGEGQPDAEARRLLSGIRALVRRFSLSERADVECCGMTVAQAAMLDALRGEDGLRLSELGQRLGIAPSTLTRNLSRIEEKGLVARKVDAEDARAFRVSLTASGRQAAARLEELDVAFARTVIERLPVPRRAATLGALTELMVAVREATEACCPGAFDHLMQDFPRACARTEDENGCC
jgi:DNA-binding MarR family transcriptional regulator